MSQGPILRRGFTNPPLVATLPTNPADGDECYYLADATNGVIWHLRYRSGASIYKWEVLGGSPLRGSAAMSLAITTTYSGTAPVLTLPLAGDYDLTSGGAGAGGGASIYMGIGFALGAAAVDGNYATSIAPPASGLGLSFPDLTRRKTGITAGTVMTGKAAILVSGTGTINNISLAAMPVRVG